MLFYDNQRTVKFDKTFSIRKLQFSLLRKNIQSFNFKQKIYLQIYENFTPAGLRL